MRGTMMASVAAGLTVLHVVASGAPLQQEMQILASREAEKSRFAGKSGPHVHNEPWASGGADISYWGELGDTVEWETEFVAPQSGLQLAVRYAFDAREYKRRAPLSANTHVLHLYIDEQGPLSISLEDTRGWNWYGVATLALPPISPGRHVFKLVSPAAGNAANLDCFTFFRGGIDPAAPTPLRPGVVHETSATLLVLASPCAQLPVSPAEVAKTFERLRELMAEDFGRTPQLPILVHFLDPAHWDRSHGRAVKNRFGIYLLADDKLQRADWCWALAECFGEQRLPRWFRDSSARVSGLLDWLPAIEESTTPYEDTDAANLVSEARRLLASEDARTTRVEVVHAAVRAKYGEDVFRKFWHLLREEEKAAPKALAPLDKLGVMMLLSRAAGSDVTPLYRRWTGFAEEGPVDPLVVTDVPTRM